ncbi:MAG: hypothetical protein H6Q08_1494 [Acidobacteria bacterium]|jgi:uncharacterized protein (TIGR00255 family)|nr:hypothetical protein [Acidobacteriota bacterium]
MIVSMTGFASAARENDLAVVTATVKTVNHRYLDVQVRVPAVLAAAESELKALLQRRLARGRVELMISVQVKAPAEPEIEMSEPVVAALVRALERGRAMGLDLAPVTTADLLRFPQALVIRERVPGADEAEQGSLLALARDAVDAAAEDACTMRVREGGFLDADLESRRLGLGRLIDELAVAADEGRATTEARLAKRVAELATEATVEPALIAQEIVRAAARSDISEEVVRFKGHLDHWLSLARGPEPCGRKLDFLLQEMNREVNTIGSKAEGRRVAEFVVQMKAELEKMREQVQNVE